MNFQIGDVKDLLCRRVLRKLNNMGGQIGSGVDYKEELYNATTIAVNSIDANATAFGVANAVLVNNYTADVEN